MSNNTKNSMLATAWEAYWTNWAKAAGVRAVKTFFQVFASLITVDGLATGLGDIDWVRIASVAAVSAVYSVATSFAGLPEVGITGSTDTTDGTGGTADTTGETADSAADTDESDMHE